MGGEPSDTVNSPLHQPVGLLGGLVTSVLATETGLQALVQHETDKRKLELIRVQRREHPTKGIVVGYPVRQLRKPPKPILA